MHSEQKSNVEGYDKKCSDYKRFFKYNFSREDHVQSEIDKEEKDVSKQRCNMCEKLFNQKTSLKCPMILHSEEPV